VPHQCLKCGNLFHEGSTVILRGCPDCRGTRFFYTDKGLGADERKKMLAGTELTLREAIDELVKNAKEGATPAESDGWILDGPKPERIVVDPNLVPPDLPGRADNLQAIEKIRDALDAQGNIVVKMPVRPGKAKRGKREPRWDYVAPPAPPAKDAPPLFSYEGLKAVAPAATAAPIAAAAAPASAVPPAAVQTTLPLADTSAVISPIVEPAPAARAAPAPMGPGFVAGVERPETIHIAAPGRYEIDVKRLLEASPVVIQKDGTYLIHLASLFESVPKPRK
jgi:predicted  nucleic acid-binding Zn-ribbon protein